MYISHIRIQNYRNLKDFEMKLKPFTLIIGENNIGKTNLLNALGLIFSQEISFFKYRMLETDDINYQAVKKFKDSVLAKIKAANKFEDIKFQEDEIPKVIIKVTLTDLNEDQEAIAAEWFIDKDFNEAEITYEFAPKMDIDESDWLKELYEIKEKMELEEEIGFPLHLYSYKIFGGLNTTKLIDFYFLNMFKMEFLDALRDAKKELVASGDYRLLYRVLNNQAKHSGDFSEVKKILVKLQTEIKKNDELGKVLGNIQAKLKSISYEDEKDKIEFLFSSIENTELFKKLSLQYGSDPIKIDRNGMGRNNLLYIALILAHLQNCPKEKVPIYFRLIGIEEPEAHLHPHLQKHLSQNLDKQICENWNLSSCKECIQEELEYKWKCKNTQILVTSHSTHISSKLPLETTAVLFEDADSLIKANYVLDKFDKDKKDDKKHINYLKKYLDATNSEMFFARKLILVEGPAEEFLIPKFFEIYSNGETLEKYGITLVNVYGLAFKHFLEIIKRVQYINCVVLTDKDKAKVNKTNEKEFRAEKLKEEYKKNKHIEIDYTTQTETFETEIFECNSDDPAKSLLLYTLEKVHPTIGKLYRTVVYNHTTLYDKMKDSKADFAMSLLNILDEYKSERDKDNNLIGFKKETQFLSFNIPAYIEKGFKFLVGEIK